MDDLNKLRRQFVDSLLAHNPRTGGIYTSTTQLSRASLRNAVHFCANQLEHDSFGQDRPAGDGPRISMIGQSASIQGRPPAPIL